MAWHLGFTFLMGRKTEVLTPVIYRAHRSQYIKFCPCFDITAGHVSFWTNCWCVRWTIFPSELCQERLSCHKQGFLQRGIFMHNLPMKGLRSKRRSSPCIFQVVASLSTRSCVITGTTYTGTDSSRLYIISTNEDSCLWIKSLAQQQLYIYRLDHVHIQRNVQAPLINLAWDS
jgi:hypothetical protein